MIRKLCLIDPEEDPPDWLRGLANERVIWTTSLGRRLRRKVLLDEEVEKRKREERIKLFSRCQVCIMPDGSRCPVGR